MGLDKPVEVCEYHMMVFVLLWYVNTEEACINHPADINIVLLRTNVIFVSTVNTCRFLSSCDSIDIKRT